MRHETDFTKVDGKNTKGKIPETASPLPSVPLVNHAGWPLDKTVF